MLLKIAELPRNPDECFVYLAKFFNKNYAYYRRKLSNNEFEISKQIFSDTANRSSYGDIKETQVLINRLQPDDWVAYDKALDEFLKMMAFRNAAIELDKHFAGDVAEATFQIDSNDQQKIIGHCSEMKDFIAISGLFDSAHKERLVARVNQVEQEVFRNKGRLDVILAGIVDVGDAAGKFGEKAKPLFDRIKDIRNIAQKNSEEYAQIPPQRKSSSSRPPVMEKWNELGQRQAGGWR